MIEATQIIQERHSSNADMMIELDEDKKVGADESRENSLDLELERVRRELFAQMDLKERELELTSQKARQDILGKIESVLENELQCAICSELMVHATILGCMHTFCQYCINVWKRNRPGCPQCRKPIAYEARNLVVDNMIEAMLVNVSEEVQNKRKECVQSRPPLVVVLPVTPEKHRPFNCQQPNRYGGRWPRRELVPRLPAPRRPLPASQSSRAPTTAARLAWPIVNSTRQSVAPISPGAASGCHHAQPRHSSVARTGAQRLATALGGRPTASNARHYSPRSAASAHRQTYFAHPVPLHAISGRPVRHLPSPAVASQNVSRRHSH